MLELEIFVFYVQEWYDQAFVLASSRISTIIADYVTINVDLDCYSDLHARFRSLSRSFKYNSVSIILKTIWKM